MEVILGIDIGGSTTKIVGLRTDGSVIPGLYAIGDAATGFVAEIYAPPGAGFTWALNSGHMCGKIVANHIH